jgi:hypothetical protein
MATISTRVQNFFHIVLLFSMLRDGRRRLGRLPVMGVDVVFPE